MAVILLQANMFAGWYGSGSTTTRSTHMNTGIPANFWDAVAESDASCPDYGYHPIYAVTCHTCSVESPVTPNWYESQQIIFWEEVFGGNYEFIVSELRCQEYTYYPDGFQL